MAMDMLHESSYVRCSKCGNATFHKREYFLLKTETVNNKKQLIEEGHKTKIVCSSCNTIFE